MTRLIANGLALACFLLVGSTNAKAASHPPLTTDKGVVASDHESASEVGAKVLEKGGNAIDAAAATALALGVVNPSSSGIGGGGFAVIYVAKEKKLYTLDFREVGPAAISPQRFVVNGKLDPMLSRKGGLAVGVPGEVAGLEEMWKRNGALPWKDVVEPARKMADEGYLASWFFARAAGIEVIQLGDLYLHDHLEDAPWGSPPFKSGHGSPWSLDGAAERIADHLYPRLAKHFREREPNWTKPPPEELAERGPDLASALSELDETAVESLPELGEDAVRVESRPDALDILVEVRGKKLKQADPEDLALAGILAAIAENELRGRALEVRVRLVEFTNFDEYGAGVLDGATILWDRSFDVEGLRAFVETSG